MNYAESRDGLVCLAAHPLLWSLARGVRRAGAVVSVPGIGLLISDAEIARRVLLDTETFTKGGPGSLSGVISQTLGPHALGNMDGVPHRELRAKLADLLPAARVADLLAESCAPALGSLRAELLAGRQVDLVRFMRNLTGRITCHMMGVGIEDDATPVEIVRRGERMAASLSLRPPAARRLKSLHQDRDFLWELARPSYERGNPTSGSVIGRLRGAGLSFEEARGVILFMFLAGTLTTAAAVPRIVALLVDSGQDSLLRRDVTGAAAAVDEGLRFTAPLPATVRITARDCELAGRRVRAGTRLLILTCNLARDPNLFKDPDRFDITRTHDPRSRHLWYGAGPHFCLGFPLAQGQLRLVIESLSSLPRPLRIVRRRRSWHTLLPAYRSLEVEMGSSPGVPL